ncbi:hypothetical protein IV77_GL001425 [Olsenella uli DSM 7084]|nr:hypothetical protein IV77_GL001425 [Olsenella uli DSM 7084]
MHTQTASAQDNAIGRFWGASGRTRHQRSGKNGTGLMGRPVPPQVTSHLGERRGGGRGSRPRRIP